MLGWSRAGENVQERGRDGALEERPISGSQDGQAVVHVRVEGQVTLSGPRLEEHDGQILRGWGAQPSGRELVSSSAGEPDSLQDSGESTWISRYRVDLDGPNHR